MKRHWEESPGTFISDACHSCQGWEEQPQAYPGASWHREAKGTAEPAAEEPRGSGWWYKIPMSTAGTRIGTSRTTWSGLGAGGQHRPSAGTAAGTSCMAKGHTRPHHHDLNQSTAWGTNPKACFSPFSLVIRVLGRCTTQRR